MELLPLLLYSLIVGLLAFVISLLLRTRQGVLGYVGAGFLGENFGGWLLAKLGVQEPLLLSLQGASVRVVGALIGIAIILLIVKLLTGRVRL